MTFEDLRAAETLRTLRGSLMATRVDSIAELPLEELDPLELFDVRLDRSSADDDFYGYGFARVPRLILSAATGEPLVLERALVVAVHSADDAAVEADDIELEFFLDDVLGEDGEVEDDSVVVALSAFLRVWIPRLVRADRAVVLAVCNPHRATLTASGWGCSVPIYYPLGEAVGWVETPDSELWNPSELHFGLSADRWCLLSHENPSRGGQEAE